MNIVHSCTSNSYSGLENYVFDLVRWQYRNNKSVTLFCREGSPLESKARSEGIPLWTIGLKEGPGPLLWLQLREKWRQWSQAGDMILHMHAGGEPWFHMPWLLRKPRALRKAILQYHIWINHKKNDPVHRLFFSGVDEVWASSESARAHLASLLPVQREHMRVMPYGRDVRSLQSLDRQRLRDELRHQFGLQSDDVLAVCIARLEKIKGVAELVEAFASVAPQNPRAHLLIVGDASPLNAEAAQYAARLRERRDGLDHGVRARLHMPGYLSDCLPVFAGGDFYVLPSYEECLSLAMLDAAILGLPIIGTSSGGTPSIVRPGETGALVPAANIEALAHELNVFYGDAGIRQKLGENARALGETFDQEEIFRGIWDSYATNMN